ncbi:MAG: energy-coupling factor ABC transporter permease [Nitrospiraceae bacterium]|nr:MAG: energy-coupling factor ABC transporter permease [Nitrospiraceae bacterium]
MHMSDALLSPAIGATFWTGSLAAIAYSAGKLKEQIDEKLIPLMGVLAAFIFAAQMINFIIPGTGSSGHLGGGMMLAIMLGPYAGFIAIASVLIVQSLFFADGGILALGCNIWNIGIYPCFIAYPFIYKIVAGDTNSPKRIFLASVMSVIAGLQLGAVSVVVQTVLSGRSELSLYTFLFFMLPIHLGIGLVEGVVTAGVVNYVRTMRPEVLASAHESKPLSSDRSIKKVLLTFFLITVFIVGVLSWFASKNPDGLEWSLEQMYGKSELSEQDSRVSRALNRFQEKTAIFPDYRVKKGNEKIPGNRDTATDATWPQAESDTTVSGLAGAFMVLCLIFALGFGIKKLKRRKNA